ncbi:hypothetical protein ABLE93_16385 [Xanthobacter sp. KR7-65]|uniref:hypothetical protein n=1 Tax=Xanthobacter sp. KR7-65 TaxID=3156612 RepID=UPI0032B41339
MAPLPDVPPAICRPAAPAPKAKTDTGAVTQARQGALARFGDTLYYRAGDDLFALPVRYALAPPEPALLGCVIRSRESTFAFPLSDVSAAMAATAGLPGQPPPRDAGLPAAGDPIIRVTAFHLGPHPDFKGMTATISSVRNPERRQGFLHDLERFPADGGDYLVRISEDRGVLARLPATPETPDAVARLWFQTPLWSAAVEIPAETVARWDTVYAAIDAFVAKYTVKGYFKK